MLIVLDTNLLPRQGKVKNVAISTLLRIAPALGATVAIPRVVLAESINARRQVVQQAIDQHNAAVANLAKYCEINAAYFPSLETIVDEWKEELETSFAVLELDGEDAIEALEREAMRRKPAKVNGTGARDSAIWLCVKRCHFERAGDTHFASGNTEDFATSKRDHSLHPNLVEELGERSSDFHYHTSIDSVIDALCSRTKVSLTMKALSSEILLSIIDQIVDHEDLGNFPEFSDRSPEDFGPIESLYFTSIDVRSAYSAAEVTVGFGSATFQMPLAPEAHETLGTSVTGRLGGWFALTGDGQVAEFDVTMLRSLSYVRAWEEQDGAAAEL
ncbi:PIN domain-containing protein [Streptomyces sp. NPDC047853]|uniref:PIN domain-containing protein n=1 Tax=unclassified Streptomyces TaxID=2593676 RepID=UPI0034527621